MSQPPDGEQVAGRSGPLGHLRVVELPGLVPVPFAAMLLADLGAHVVRIARPPHALGPLEPAETTPLYRGRADVVVLDLKQPADVETLLGLLDAADVLVEGFRPGVMERLGLGPQVCCERNPALVYARLTGWGQTGPLAQRAGHDLTYLALSGVLGATGPPGGPPQNPGVTVADLAGGGMLTVIGVLAALAERERSGRGQVVDAAMVDGSALLAAFPIGLRVAGLLTRPPGQNLLDGGAPFYASYACADGEYLAVGPLEPAFYAQFLTGLGLAGEDLPDQYDTAGWPVLRRRFAEVIAQHPRGHWESVFDGTDACVAPVLSPWQAHRHPHAVARDAFVEVADVVQPAPAPRFSRTPTGVPDTSG